ncbi:MAG: hypothetical protein QXI84_09230 [Thermofilaceae archaeon]
MMIADPLQQIRKLLEKGPAHLYTIAKAFGLSYGSVQWYAFDGMRKGLWKMRRVAEKVVVYLPGQDPLDAVTMGDLIMCLKRHAPRDKPLRELPNLLRMCLDEDLLRELLG